MAKSTARYNKDKPNAIRKKLEDNYFNRFKVLFFSTLNFDGLDFGMEDWLKDQIWLGTDLAIFKLNTALEDESPCAIQPFVGAGWDRYNNPIKVQIMNLRDDKTIPKKTLTNHEDVALWRAKLNYRTQIEPFVKSLVDVDMTIRTNIKLHKIPFVIDGSQQAMNAINAVLDDNEVIALDDTSMLKSAKTDTPYIIDKLNQHKIALTSDILSILGIKGQKLEKMAQMTVDEVNNNSEEINGFKNYLIDSLTMWFEEGNKLFGTSYKVTTNDVYEEVEEVEEEKLEEEGVENDL